MSGLWSRSESAAARATQALGSGDAVSREQLRARRCAALRGPALAAPSTALRGAGPKLGRGGGRARDRDDRRPALGTSRTAYRDRSAVREVGELRIGEQATVMVEVRSARVRPTRRRNLRIVEATVADDSGPMKAVWFNQAWLAERLRPGTRLLLNGKLDRAGFRVAAHEIVGEAGRHRGSHTTGLVPVHPRHRRADQPQPAARLGLAGDRRAPLDAVEPLPGRAPRPPRASGRGRRPALRSTSPRRAGRPRRWPASGSPSRSCCLHQVALALRRGGRQRSRPGDRDRARRASSSIGGSRSLPFEPTGDQRAALERDRRRPGSGRPMQRLLMGEVGSGKTVVALYAMLRALEAGHQAALMAPTETLAEQHAATLDRLLG